LASASDDRSVGVWDLAQMLSLSFQSPCICFCVSCASHFFCLICCRSADYDGLVRLWDIETGTIHCRSCHKGSIAVSPTTSSFSFPRVIGPFSGLPVAGAFISFLCLRIRSERYSMEATSLTLYLCCSELYVHMFPPRERAYAYLPSSLMVEDTDE
jgi:WD40 repeat protein